MNAAIRALYHVPFVGWALRDAVGGRTNALYLLVAYLLLAAVGLVYHFGYPALIVLALAATAFCLAFLVVLTTGDLFSRPNRKG